MVASIQKRYALHQRAKNLGWKLKYADTINMLPWNGWETKEGRGFSCFDDGALEQKLDEYEQNLHRVDEFDTSPK